MGRKKALEKRMTRLQNKINDLTARSQADDVTVEELRSIQCRMNEIREDMQDVQDELDAIEEEQRSQEPEPSPEPVNGAVVRGMFGQQTSISGQVTNPDPYATTEYRMAFKDYVQRGTPIPANLNPRMEQRAGGDTGPTVAAELGMIIPTTIMNEFITKVSKVYGQLYSKVRKLNIQGGVKFPISDLKANFKWITETAVSERQKAGDIKEYIEFSYNIGEIRVSQTLLSQVVTLAMFEQEIVRIMVEAYVEAMDKGIMSGSGSGQMLGILNDTRVTSNPGHTIEFTAAEFSDWEKWRKKLFSIIPLSKRGQGEFIFTSGTVEANLLTMKDNNNRPIFREATELNVGESATSGRFYGREVTLVEPDIVADFETARSGDVVGIYWIPNDYAINTNLAFGMKRYFDENKNEWVNKGLTIVDGKMLDVSGCYIIKKK